MRDLPADGLLERDAEIGELANLMDGARRGDGRFVMVEGSAGIGKTALLAQTCRQACAAGMAVLTARGGEHESEFGHGIVRQLFEPMLRQARPAEREALLAGAGALAAPAIDVTGGGAAAGEGPPTDLHAVLHGLYWLTANAAEVAPLLLAVDDLQWSDSPSLRYLLYLARRLEGLQVLVVAGARPGEPGTDLALISQIAAAPGTRTLRPSALSHIAVGLLVRTRLSGGQDPAFVSACHAATGGVPFLVHELLRTLARDGVPATAEAATRVGELGPRTVADATLLRLAPLGAAATAVARAVALLGRHADLRRVAMLASLTHEQASTATDALAEVHVLGPRRPLEFVHPIVRAAVYEALAPGERSAGHARAAALLAEEAADAAEVATHLLLTEPGGAPELIDTMREAAADALSRGAAESAIAYLRRAVAEAATAPTRALLLHELGCAEAVVRDPQAVLDLQESLRLTRDPARRARLAYDLAGILIYGGEWEAAIALIHAGIADLGDRDPELRVRLEASWVVMAAYDPRFIGEFDRRSEELYALAGPGGGQARTLGPLLTALAAFRADRLDEVVSLVQRSLAGATLLADESAEAWIAQPVAALVSLDELDDAGCLAQAKVDEALGRGSVVGLASGWTCRVHVSSQRGELGSAEADLRAAFDLASEHELLFLMPTLLRFGMDVLLERSGLGDIAAAVEHIRLEPPFSATASGALPLEVRGRLRLTRGETDSGVEDLRRCGEICEGLRLVNPNCGFGSWRTALALALRASAPAEAAGLVERALALADATGLPRSQGIALRTAGLVRGGTAGIDLLCESLAVLDRSPAALERARTLVELGAALRRSNERAAARDPLRAGLDLARRCGADRLATRAHEELKATGARPRRLMITGRDALTPSERRVAQMAADGRSNRHIAQELFVTIKTIENQLSSIYRKLAIPGRGHLTNALAARTNDLTRRNPRRFAKYRG